MDMLPGNGSTDDGHRNISWGQTQRKSDTKTDRQTCRHMAPTTDIQTERQTDTNTSRLNWWFCMETLPGGTADTAGYPRANQVQFRHMALTTDIQTDRHIHK